MDKRMWIRRASLVVLALAFVSFLRAMVLATDEESNWAPYQQAGGLDSNRGVDFFNLFPHVGAFLVWADPNDAGLLEGLMGRCTATLVHERAVLTAGHCVAPTAAASPPFLKFYVTFSPNALDRSTWRAVSGQAVHPSLPPCPPPDLCTFHGLDPGILDIGLVFLSEPVRGIRPATLARPNTLDSDRAEDALMILPGYGDLASLPAGGPQAVSRWDGWRRIKISRLSRIVDNEWASWSLPGVVCFGDSGSPTFLYDESRNRPSNETLAVASDGGDVCFSRDDRARVDTESAREWVRRTIAQMIPKS